MPDCQHEAPPYPSKRIVESKYLPGPAYSRIVPCIHCGEPLDRGRDSRVMVTRDYVNDHPEFDFSAWEGDE